MGCESAAFYAHDSYSFSETGFGGPIVNWRHFGTVSHRVFREFLINCPNRWMGHTSVY
jgi:hypothetical protein